MLTDCLSPPPPPRCEKPNCMWGARWYVTCFSAVASLLTITPLLQKLHQINIESHATVATDITTTICACVPGFAAYHIIIILVDLGIIPSHPWYTVASLLVNLSLVAIMTLA